MSKINWGMRACGVFLLWAVTAVALPAQTLTTLHSFAGAEGSVPYAGLTQGADGKFYGTTRFGGTNNNFNCPLDLYNALGCGTVFSITPSGPLTTLYNFCSQGGENCTDGALPTAALVQAADGNFYGTTGYGTVFNVTPSGMLTTLNGASDLLPLPSGIIQGTDGNFYGTTYFGGPNNNCFFVQPNSDGCGTVFSITQSGALTTLYNFCSQSGKNCTDGALPDAALVQGTDGNFYGTTQQGGPANDSCVFSLELATGCGTIFKITPSGTLTALYNFCPLSGCADGYGPAAGLVQGTDGNFYGTTFFGGANGDGTVFKITPSGTLMTLHSFDGTDGGLPEAGLVQGTDGNLYGTTFEGGANGYGAVFKITLSGTLTTLHSFDETDGSYPMAALVQGTDGSFYGTTELGGGNGTCFFGGCGTVFSLSVGLGTQVTVSPPSVSFAPQPIGATSAAQTVMLTNSGKLSLTITSIAITGTNVGDFSQTNTCGTSVAAGASCTLSITFTPSATGTSSASVTLTDSAANGPQTIALAGTGMDFSAPANSPGSLTLPAGQSGTFTATVTPIPSNTTFSGPVTFTCTGAPQASTCTPGSAVTNADGSVTSTVTVTTTARSAVPFVRFTPPATAPVGLLLLLTLGMLLALGTFLVARRLHFSWLDGRRFATVALVLVLLSCGVLAACGSSGGGASNGTPAGTYTLTVTASSGGLSHSSTLQLTVQ